MPAFLCREMPWDQSSCLLSGQLPQAGPGRVWASRGSVGSELGQGASHPSPTDLQVLEPNAIPAVDSVSISWPEIPSGTLLVLVRRIFQKL